MTPATDWSLTTLTLACVGVFGLILALPWLLHAAGPGLFALLRRALGS